LNFSLIKKNMPQVELIMPKMGESIMEATILKWLKKEGDSIAADESVLEIATDKVDSEVPASQAGTLIKILYQEGEVVAVGKPIAIIGTGGDDAVKAAPVSAPVAEPMTVVEKVVAAATQPIVVQQAATQSNEHANNAGRFYSPLVLNIARSENISMVELEQIDGSGKDNRVTKSDILTYVEQRKNAPAVTATATPAPAQVSATVAAPAAKVEEDVPVEVYYGNNVEVIEMDRMRKRIAENMVASKRISAHVTSFVEADVTNMVLWRDRVKKEFEKRENEKITFTPLFVEAVTKALKDFPKVNASVVGDKIIVKRDLNIGMATALPTGNLIVPVIKNADQYNLVGLTKRVNDLALRARNNKLKTEDIEGGTFTISNVGTFGNLMGTPIIPQPQVAILATVIIKKKAVVVETPAGDSIAIRHMMFLSLSYDHRIVDGALGGSFLRKIADYMEAFDPNRTF
jgi:2-oxoglutarate dehydrogenase E2 component (dihydrolipoamide succinyltransferase)